MIKVLQVGMVYNLGGGIQTFIMNYYKNSDRDKIQFDFINIYGDKFYYKEEIESLGGRIYNVSNYNKNPFKFIKEMKKIIRENHYDIIHCNMNSAVFLWPIIAAKLARAKVIIAHSHNASSDKGLLKSAMHSINKHFIPFFANTYFACSEKAGKWFFSKRIINSNNFYVINNAISINDFKYSESVRNKVREELEIDNDTTVLCHVGRFTKQKNHVFLINAFKRIYTLNPKTKLFLIGTGPLIESTKNLVKNLKLDNNVIFLGQRNDVSKIMCAADIFVLPSLYEGLPLVGVEAQVSGLKCYISEKVTKELKLLEETEFLQLKLEDWEKISSFKKEIDRSKCYLLCKKFDIKTCAEKLFEIYKKLGE